MQEPVTVIRKSQLTGKVHQMHTPNLSQQQYEAGMKAMQEGALVQDAFPQLTASEREFIMTGITPDEWAAMEAALEEE